MSNKQSDCGCESCGCQSGESQQIRPARDGQGENGYPEIVIEYAKEYGLPQNWCDDILKSYKHELSLLSANCDWATPSEFSPLLKLAKNQDSNLQSIITPEADNVIEWANDPYLTSDIIGATMAFFGEYILAIGHHESTHENVLEAFEQHAGELGAQVTFNEQTLPGLCRHIGKQIFSQADSYTQYLRGWQFDAQKHGIDDLIGTHWTVYPAVDVVSYRMLEELDVAITPESEGYSITGELIKRDSMNEIYKDNRRLFDPPYSIRIDECGGEIPPSSPYDLSIYSEGDIINVLPGTLRYATQH